MSNLITGDTLTGDIILQYPTVSRLFTENHIDFCTSGNTTVNDALKEKGVNIDDFLTRVNALAELESLSGFQKKDWAKSSITDITTQIINEHHRHMKQELDEIEKLERQVVAKQGDVHPELQSVHLPFKNLKAALLYRIEWETTVSFKWLAKIGQNVLTDAYSQDLTDFIRNSKESHDETNETLKQIRRLTHDFRVPKKGDPKLALYYRKLQALEEDVYRYIHLETNVLFKKITETLSLKDELV